MNDKSIPALSFKAFTPLFDVVAGLLGYGRKEYAKVVTLLNLQPDERLLDLGCGSGSLLTTAIKRNTVAKLFGIDVDDDILRIAQHKLKKNGADSGLIQGGANRLPFGDGVFDVVVSTLVFHHLTIEIKIRALEEIHRVLRDDGRFLLADFGPSDRLFFRAFVGMVNALRLPEAISLRDNVSGRIPALLTETGFYFSEIAPPYRGIRYLLARKSAAQPVAGQGS